MGEYLGGKSKRERVERRIIAFPRKTKIDCIRADSIDLVTNQVD